MDVRPDAQIVAQPLLSVRDLCVQFPIRSGLLQRTTGFVRAVDGVSFDLLPGQTLGLVGESGCGKSTTGRAVLRLIPATSGRVMFEGRNVLGLSVSELRPIRRSMQIVFQDPGGSLNPRMRVEEIVAEPLMVHSLAATRDERRAKVEALLVQCGMPASAADRYPHEFSGGQRQRIAIARAVALRPKLIICDEPTSALDVSVQAQILNLLSDLQRDYGMSYLFISHDMAVVNQMCDRVAVMLGGKIIESGTRDEIIRGAKHEYTRRLLEAVPQTDPRKRRTATFSRTG